MVIGLQLAGALVFLGGVITGGIMILGGSLGGDPLGMGLFSFGGVIWILGGILGSLPWFALAGIYDKVNKLARHAGV